MFDTNHIFASGELTVTLDGGAGSSGKGKLNAWLCKHADNWQFACNAFMSNAAHWIETNDGTRIMYQHLNSCAYTGRFEKIYICGGAVVELGPLLKEIEENGLTEKTFGIHPLVAIVQDKDIGYEEGTCNFDGDPVSVVSDNLKIGSTLHGVGAARARRILRRSDVLLVRDIKKLKPFMCDTRHEIVERLDNGQAGLLEIAQGFQLGYLEHLFYPKTTSRNCSISAGLDDCGIPPFYTGNVVINFRTFPIRVCSNKYLHKETGKILTQEELSTLPQDSILTIKGDSGAGYPDQVEITWEDLSKNLDEPVIELSSLTKLPRRVFTFSTQNLIEAMKYNRASGRLYVSINFANYIDQKLNLFDGSSEYSYADVLAASPKLRKWDKDNNIGATIKEMGGSLLCLGTGPKNDEMIQLND